MQRIVPRPRQGPRALAHIRAPPDTPHLDEYAAYEEVGEGPHHIVHHHDGALGKGEGCLQIPARMLHDGT